ncbi:hypothetical protein FOG50_00256 [Hanseniaspora uvarum]|nr:hypothetical protein FOG50_00256 [Hanseniaspora uvarum]
MNKIFKAGTHLNEQINTEVLFTENVSMPRGLFTFTKSYIRDLCFVIIDSFTWPINLILGIMPIYHKENSINKILTGNISLPYIFYLQVVYRDILCPMVMNFLLVLTVGFMIGLSIFVLHKALTALHTEKLVITINPFETTKTIFDNAYNDVKWVFELVNTTAKTFSDLLKPLNSLRNMDEEIITTELKQVHQKYNPMTIKGTMNILSVVKGKVFNKNETAEVQTEIPEKKSNTRPFSQATGVSFDDMDGELTRRKIILRRDSSDKKADKNTIQRISSIDVAESLPKNFFQDKNSTEIAEDSTVSSNTTKKLDDNTTNI